MCYIMPDAPDIVTLDMVVINIPPNDWSKVRRLKSKFSEISIIMSEDFSGDYSILKFSCPDSLTLTREQAEKFSDILEKVFCYEKKGVKYSLADEALKKVPRMFLDYGTVKHYMERLQT